jgi:hypothetical protein
MEGRPERMSSQFDSYMEQAMENGGSGKDYKTKIAKK